MWIAVLATAAVALSLVALLLVMRRGGGIIPSRASAPEVVSDLDALVSKPVGFRLHGRTHKIPPLKNLDFMRAVNAFAGVDLLRAKDQITDIELLEAYERVFAIMCPTVTRKQLEEMEQSQVAALFNLCCETVMGKAQVRAEKKTPKIVATRTQQV